MLLGGLLNCRSPQTHRTPWLENTLLLAAVVLRGTAGGCTYLQLKHCALEVLQVAAVLSIASYVTSVPILSCPLSTILSETITLGIYLDVVSLNYCVWLLLLL